MKNKSFINISKWIILAALIAVLSFVCVACDVPSSSDGVPSDGSTLEPSGNEPSIENPSGNGPSVVNPSDDDWYNRYDTTAWAESFTLPDADGALEKLNTIYGGAEKVFLLQNGRIARMPCPQ
ncbi:MAG: hypothetical protein K2G31_00630, partial [Clostridia bacterium]|nr:hypothetical protein [Clostridia bacterium]